MSDTLEIVRDDGESRSPSAEELQLWAFEESCREGVGGRREEEDRIRQRSK